jgi:hypothetical protein
MKTTPTPPSLVEGEGYRGLPVEGEGEVGHFRPHSVSASAPKGTATKDESVCLPGRQAFAIDIRVVCSGEDTEKPGEYQEKLLLPF